MIRHGIGRKVPALLHVLLGLYYYLSHVLSLAIVSPSTRSALCGIVSHRLHLPRRSIRSGLSSLEYVTNSRRVKASRVRLKSTTIENENSGSKGRATSDPSQKDRKGDETSGPTLYDILQVPSSATREEIKASFVKLAKITHPDARLASNPNASAAGVPDNAKEQLSTSYTFDEISKAYKRLMDPLSRKRYDRELVAEAFKRDVERAAAEVGSVAGPQLKSILDKVAFPMFRRTSATTSAVFNEVFKDLQESRERKKKGRALRPSDGGEINANNATAFNITDETIKALESDKGIVDENNYDDSDFDIRRIISSAVAAGRNAGRTIDRLEQSEKSRDLEKRAKIELLRANALRRKANKIMEKRLQATLRTPNAPISSRDAILVVDMLNNTDAKLVGGTTGSLFGNIMNRRSIEDEVMKLAELEATLEEKTSENRKSELGYEHAKAKVEKYENMLSTAEQSAVRAREALKRAEEQVEKAKYLIVDAQQNVTAIEYFRKSTRVEVDQAMLQVTRQQERVRSQLHKKEESMEGSLLEVNTSSDSVNDEIAATTSARSETTANATTSNSLETVVTEEEAAAILTEDGRIEDELDLILPENLSPEEGLKIVEKLQRMEASVLLECQRREDAAGRLRSRAEKLRNMAGEPLEEAFS